MTSKTVLMVGLPSADWTVMLPLLDAGRLPALRSLIDGGTTGKILTVEPCDPAAVWTSVACGKRPHRHRILGTIEPTSDGQGVRATTCLGRQAKALWNILGQNGIRGHVIGWPATHPAEPIDGVIVSDWFPFANPEAASQESESGGDVHPAALRADLLDLCMRPDELTPEDLRFFIPDLDRDIAERDPRVTALARIFTETASIQGVATEVMQRDPAPFTAVWFPGIERVSRLFGNFHPPRPAFVDNADFELYRHVVESAYRFHDMMLAALMGLAGPEATVLVVADEGFPFGAGRSDKPRDEPGAPPERRAVGMWVLAGPGIKQDELLFGTSILDLAPTLLHHMGMAVGRDMDGRVLTGAFEDPGDVDFIESWERVDGPDGRHPPDIWTGPLDEVSSGNAGLAPVDDPVWLASAGLRLGRAKSLIEAGDGAEAVPILHDLWRTDPSEPHYGDILIGCLLGLGRADLAHAALERLFAHRKRHAPAALKAWRELDRRDPDTLTSAERGRKAQLWKRSRSNIAGMAVLRAQILSVDGKVAEALQAIEAIDPDKVHDRPGLLRLKADCLARLERWDEAEALYTGLHEEDPDDPDNILHLARFAFDRKRFAEAANLALRSVGLRYYNPMAHYTYATSIFHCGQPQKAADALKVAVSQDPHMIPAYDRLTALYGGPLRDPQQAEIYHQRAQRAAAHRRADQEAREAALGAFMRETAEEWGLATKP